MKAAQSNVETGSVLAVAEIDVDRRVTYAKVTRRLVPLLFLAYTLSFLDRVNIGFAKAQMQHDLGFSEAAYGVAAGIFFLGYAAFEVPSNLLLARIGARLTLARIMILWGLASVATMAVTGPHTLYLARFLLGVFEAGFGPGMVYYLTLWFAKARHARVMSYVLLAPSIASIFGGPISHSIIEELNGLAGLHGWQWLFLVEGVPCIALGILFLFVLVDDPAKAKWLSPLERRVIVEDLGQTDDAQLHDLGPALRDVRLYILAFAYFGIISIIYAIGLWLPTLLSMTAVGAKGSAYYYSIPYVASVVSMIAVARSSDRSGERYIHLVFSILLAVISLVVAGLTLSHFWISFAAIIVANAAIYAGFVIFWTIPTRFLKGRAAAGGVALVNSLGLVGGFVGPAIIGAMKDGFGSYAAGLLAIAGICMLGLLLVVATRRLLFAAPAPK